MFIRERELNLIVRDQRMVLKVVRKTEGFDVFLEAGRDGALVAPEAVTCELVSQTGVDSLDGKECISPALCCKKRLGVLIGRVFAGDSV
jgi:hypothetical protein